MIKNYLQLSKPGIIAGNIIAAVAGFLLAAKGHIDWPLLMVTMLSIVLIIASGCAFNNCIDRDIDGKMQRTQNRVLVTGQLTVQRAAIFALLTGITGFSLMLFYTNIYTLAFGILGYVVYVGLYSLIYKRTSVYSTAIGSISGACPPVMGYLAVTNQFDLGALILLIAFCLWQIPHSYAIAIFRFQDYKNANIPVLPVKEGIKTARSHIIFYIIAFIAVALLLTQQHYAGLLYAASMLILGLYWAYIATAEYNEQSLQAWGKKMFVLSIITICCFSLLISTDYVALENSYRVTQQ